MVNKSITQAAWTPLNRFVQGRIKREVGIVLRMYPPARPHYVRLRGLDLLGVHANPHKVIPLHSKTFLFVCFGNIMRSPMAEVLFRKFADEEHVAIHARSAGLHAINGSRADPRAQTAATDCGISLENHRAQMLTAEMTEQADVIFTMDFQNQAELVARYPSFEKKICLLATFSNERPRLREIADPYLGGPDAMQHICTVLAGCIRNLICEVKVRQDDARLRGAL
jgi:protein-tyrosine phosphatase